MQHYLRQETGDIFRPCVTWKVIGLTRPPGRVLVQKKKKKVNFVRYKSWWYACINFLILPGWDGWQIKRCQFWAPVSVVSKGDPKDHWYSEAAEKLVSFASSIKTSRSEVFSAIAAQGRGKYKTQLMFKRQQKFWILFRPCDPWHFWVSFEWVLEPQQ